MSKKGTSKLDDYNQKKERILDYIESCDDINERISLERQIKAIDNCIKLIQNTKEKKSSEKQK